MDGANASDLARLDVDAVLADVRQLQDSRAHRDARGLHYVEGVRNVVQAGEHGVHLHTLIVSETLLKVNGGRTV